MPPKRILHCAESVKGGVGSVLNHLARAQLKSGSDVLCVLPESEEGLLVAGCRPSSFSRERRDVRSQIRLAAAIARTVWRERPDVVHLHSTFAGLAGRLVLPFMRPLRRPAVIYSPHCFSFMMEVGVAKQRLYAWAEWLVQGLADKIICVSQCERQAALAWGLSARRLELVYNGVPDDAAVDEEPASRTGPLKLLFVGRLDRQKGCDVLIEAMRAPENAETELTVVGAALVGSAPVVGEAPPNVKFVGWKDAEAVKQYMRHCDAVVVPSRWEGFAMVPLEAMSAAKAVIASDSSSMPEVVTDGVTGLLFRNNDSSDLAAVLASLTREQCIRFGLAGRQAFLSRFTSGEMIEGTAKVYETALASL